MDEKRRNPTPRTGSAESGARPHPELAAGFAGLVQLVDRLLGPNGCPWDKAQTLDTLRPYLLEETYEVLEAMHDPVEHREELGDLLFQIVLHSGLRKLAGEFDIEAVVAGITDKMVRRHPHVFAGESLEEPGQVERRWAELKAAEKPQQTGKNPLHGVPKDVPALTRAYRLQEKAAAIGFDWPDVIGVLDKLQEEVAELREAAEQGDAAGLQEELGDLLFVLVRLGQKLGVVAEEALRSANRKFEERFAFMMQELEKAGISPELAGLERLESLWSEAKTAERAAGRSNDT